MLISQGVFCALQAKFNTWEKTCGKYVEREWKNINLREILLLSNINGATPVLNMA